MKGDKTIFNGRLLDIVGFLVIFLFLMSYFRPNLILLDTTTAGGDTATHNYPANYMHEYLIKEGKIIGWSPGWYAGFPMFQFYFPLLFVFIHSLSYITALNVAFKLTTILGTFLLPICTFASMRMMGFKKPTPILAASFSLAFLFMEANSMWGGNIPSTLAGEFSFSFSFALTVLFSGLLYKKIVKENGKFSLKDSVLFSLITLSHVYTALFSVASSVYFILTKDRDIFIRRSVYFFKTYGIAFLLTAFWIIPLITKIGYTTSYNHVWDIKDIQEVFPKILLPFYLISIVSIIHAFKKTDRRIVFLTFSIAAAFVLYRLSPYIGIVDIRFVPFIQFYPIMIAAYGLGQFINHVGKGNARMEMVMTVIAIFSVIFWVNMNVFYIDTWIKWNYDGFEKKSLWEPYITVNEFLEGDQNDPRVVYEHSTLHDYAGSTRAFENLPLFSGRSTLEGLYMQSSLSSPFVFYIQSEVSEQQSCPFPDYRCDELNVTKAVPRLKLFNVEYVIARSDTAIAMYQEDDNYEHVASISPFEIFKLEYEYGYVTVPKYEPVYFETDNRKETAYEWFKNDDALDVHLVFDSELEARLVHSDNLDELPKVRILENCEIEEHVYNEEIRFNTTCVNQPHIIKISYFPNWKVEGADKIYMVSPSFMLVYPKEETVRIYYGETTLDNASQFISVMGIFVVLSALVPNILRAKSFLKR